MSVRRLIISLRLIKAFLMSEISAKALAMSAAIFGLPLVFTGTKPYTALQITGLVNTFNTAKANYKVGGLLFKPAYLAAKLALLNCILAFGPYVDSIALGDETISDMSTLPNNKPIDYVALILAGLKATFITGTKGVISGQLVTNCKSIASGVGYFAILSEGAQLMAGFTITSNGQVCIPEGMTNRVFINVTASRRKIFNNLLPNTQYYLTYVLICGDTVGLMSDPVPVSCGGI